MSCAVEAYPLGYPCGFEPLFQRCLRHAVLKFREYAPRASRPGEFQCLVAYRVVHEVFRLLHPYRDVHPAVAVRLYVLPRKGFHVALAQSRQAGKEVLRNPVRQAKRKAFFSTGASHGVSASRISSSCERCSFSVGMVSMRSRNPLGFSRIFRSR